VRDLWSSHQSNLYSDCKTLSIKFCACYISNKHVILSAESLSALHSDFRSLRVFHMERLTKVTDLKVEPEKVVPHPGSPHSFVHPVFVEEPACLRLVLASLRCRCGQECPR
jgi:hypothetical protein